MIISAITMENFKSIKEPVRIELKPITLLFGPNSVGKSTIIQALNYAREVMKTSRVDIDQTESGGDTIRLGGFSNIIYNHDFNNAIRLKFELDVPEFDLKHDENIDEKIEDACEEFHTAYPDDSMRLTRYYREQIKKRSAIWFEIIIEQESKETNAYISKASAGVGNDALIVIGCEYDDGSLTQKVQYIDVENPIFPVIDKQSLASYFMTIVSPDQEDVSAKEKGGEISLNPLHTLPDCIFKLWADGNLYSLQINNDFKDHYLKFEAILDAIWSIHFQTVKNDLMELCYLGPLREIPDASFDPHDPISHRWDKGLAAWANIFSGSDYDIAVVNEAFKEDLKIPYEIVRKKYKEFDLDSQLYKIIAKNKICDKASVIKQMVEKLPTKNRIFLKEVHNNAEMLLKDVGVGISQVVPILPLAISGGWDIEGIIAIEQPELHVHPAIQVGLADVFIDALQYENNMLTRKRFILETHSEHILLRLLRRIRDPKEGTMEELTSNELSIYFLEPSKRGVTATRIRVNEEGEFIDPWPRGFFNERSEELF